MEGGKVNNNPFLVLLGSVEDALDFLIVIWIFWVRVSWLDGRRGYDK
jgi:hypothetical protein